VIIHDPTIAERYARALLAVAKRQGAVAEVMEDSVVMMPRSDVGVKLSRFLDAPQIAPEAKVELVRKALEGRVHQLLYDLIRMLLARKRIEYTRAILTRFVTLAEQEQGIYPAQVVTAKPLDDDQKQQMSSVLERFTRSKLRIKYVVDPSVIGGVRFSYGEVLVDDTIRGKLTRMFHHLERMLHEQGRM
jgi:F-type H+-transporting ATPase subunit delta